VRDAFGQRKLRACSVSLPHGSTQRTLERGTARPSASQRGSDHSLSSRLVAWRKTA